MSDEHEFGGPWTEIKLDAIGDYLGFYTRALRTQPTPDRPFTLWYVDAFAGSGKRTAKVQTGGLFEKEPIGEAKVLLPGSAERALKVDPPFAKLIFIEKNRRRYAALQAAQGTDPRVDCVSAWKFDPLTGVIGM
jgi:three-Cys-motif partner protein